MGRNMPQLQEDQCQWARGLPHTRSLLPLGINKWSGRAGVLLLFMTLEPCLVTGKAQPGPQIPSRLEA